MGWILTRNTDDLDFMWFWVWCYGLVFFDQFNNLLRCWSGKRWSSDWISVVLTTFLKHFNYSNIFQLISRCRRDWGVLRGLWSVMVTAGVMWTGVWMSLSRLNERTNETGLTRHSQCSNGKQTDKCLKFNSNSKSKRKRLLISRIPFNGQTRPHFTSHHIHDTYSIPKIVMNLCAITAPIAHIIGNVKQNTTFILMFFDTQVTNNWWFDRWMHDLL